MVDPEQRGEHPLLILKGSRERVEAVRSPGTVAEADDDLACSNHWVLDFSVVDGSETVFHPQAPPVFVEGELMLRPAQLDALRL